MKGCTRLIVVAFVFALFQLALPTHAVGIGMLTLATSATGNVVTIDVTIDDQGGAPDCTSFHLIRNTVFGTGPAAETRCIPRQVGTTMSYQFEDILPANRAYHYTVVGMSCLAPCVCIQQSDQDLFNLAFGSPWGLGFHAYAITGPPESTPVAHGQIVSTGWAYPTHFVEGCPGTESWGAFAVSAVQPYVDTGTDVLAYGSLFFDVQNGPLLQIASALPWSCDVPLPVEKQTWGRIKSLFR